MERKGLEWKVGLFILIGLVLVGALMLAFSKGTSPFRPTYNLYLSAKNVGGLKRTASVLLAGVKVGDVSDIQFKLPAATNVIITLHIYSSYQIHQDARFVIETSGFLGDQYVAIIPTRNEAPVFPPGGHAKVEEPFNLQEVARSASGFIQRIDETAKNLDAAISDVRRNVLNEETLTNLSAAIGSMRQASSRTLATVNNVNMLVETNAPSIAVAVSNVVYFSDQINEFGNAFGSVLSTNSTEISAAVKNIESSTEVLKNLMADLHEGKGLVGDLLRNETLASNVDTIASNLAITTHRLNRHGLWGILWSHEPPETNRPPVKSLTAPKNPFAE